MPSSHASDGGRSHELTSEEAPAQGVESESRDRPEPAGGSSPREAERDPDDRTALEDELAAQLAQVEERHKRALADLDNYRKRSGREVERRVAEGRDALLLDWLEAVDSVERALRMEQPDTPLFQGLRAVLDQVEAILARQGVERLGEAGEPFDPQRHEAIAVRDADDVPDRTVLEVARSGFAIDGRVLRPAQVVVARGERRES